MDLQERKIKDLAIAMEALSRIGGRYSVDRLMDRIQEQLESHLLDLEQAALPKTPPKSSPTDLSDEIPF